MFHTYPGFVQSKLTSTVGVARLWVANEEQTAVRSLVARPPWAEQFSLGKGEPSLQQLLSLLSASNREEAKAMCARSHPNRWQKSDTRTSWLQLRSVSSQLGSSSPVHTALRGLWENTQPQSRTFNFVPELARQGSLVLACFPVMKGLITR